MTFVALDDPKTAVVAVQFVGGFTWQGKVWPANSWLVHVYGQPGHRHAMTDAQFRNRGMFRII